MSVMQKYSLLTTELQVNHVMCFLFHSLSLRPVCSCAFPCILIIINNIWNREKETHRAEAQTRAPYSLPQFICLDYGSQKGLFEGPQASASVALGPPFPFEASELADGQDETNALFFPLTGSCEIERQVLCVLRVTCVLTALFTAADAGDRVRTPVQCTHTVHTVRLVYTWSLSLDTNTYTSVQLKFTVQMFLVWLKRARNIYLHSTAFTLHHLPFAICTVSFLFSLPHPLFNDSVAESAGRHCMCEEEKFLFILTIACLHSQQLTGKVKLVNCTRHVHTGLGEYYCWVSECVLCVFHVTLHWS